jgi:hypothetical protein
MDIHAAKKLLKKAIEIGDEELIDMANITLNNILGSEPEKMPSKREHKSDGTDFIFSMSGDTKEDKPINRNGTPVNAIKNRVNEFHDDGTEANDVTTPDVSLTERKRPAFKMIEQKCQKCGISQETHPAHKRDYYICDRCIPK